MICSCLHTKLYFADILEERGSFYNLELSYDHRKCKLGSKLSKVNKISLVITSEWVRGLTAYDNYH